MLKTAVIGVNNIGKTHAQVYATDPLSNLVAVCDLVEERAKAAAEQFGVRAYTSVEELLRNEELDVVSVATGGVENGSDHYVPTMQALEAGVNVLCEKPLCNEIGKAREMVAKAKEKGLYLGTNLNHRMVPIAWKAKEWVDQGRLGELLFVNMALWIRNPNESSPWFHLRALHPHSIDVMRYFAGDVKRVQAFCRKAPGRKIWSTASINMEFQSGAVGHLTGSYDMVTHHPIERCEVAGTKGRFVIENVYEELLFYPHDSEEVTRVHNSIMSGVKGFNDTFRHRIHRFLEQITEGVAPDAIDASGADGLAAQLVIEAAIASWEGGGVTVEVEAV